MADISLRRKKKLYDYQSLIKGKGFEVIKWVVCTDGCEKNFQFQDEQKNCKIA